MDEFKELVTIAAYAVEAYGVAVIIIGSVVASVRFLATLSRAPIARGYADYRRSVGRSIILGLEFLIAGDVIRTVIVSHTLTNVAVLAMIVVVRAFLSLTLALEIEGRLPWHKPDQKSAPTA